MSEGAPPFRAPIGTHDVLPDESAQWEGIIATFAYWANLYGFGLIVSPMFEDVGVFQRGIGTGLRGYLARPGRIVTLSDAGSNTMLASPRFSCAMVRATFSSSDSSLSP